MTQRTWAHTHYHRLKAGKRDVISLKHGREPVRYEERAVLTDVTFYVSVKGRERCLATGVRNVHAWVVGDETERPVGLDVNTWRRAIYDPWKGAAFVDSATLAPVEHADAVVMIGKLVYYR